MKKKNVGYPGYFLRFTSSNLVKNTHKKVFAFQQAHFYYINVRLSQNCSFTNLNIFSSKKPENTCTINPKNLVVQVAMVTSK